MAISPMYSAKAGSPKTQLTAELSASGTSMSVADASVLPPAPNLCVLGDDKTAEVVMYTEITGNTVKLSQRGLGGTTASVWPVNTDVARNYTSFDHDRFIENIVDLETNKINGVAWGDVTGTLANQTDLANALNGKQNVLTIDSTPTASSTNPVESGGVKTALDAKQDTLTFDTTPTASSTNPVTSGGVKSYVDSHDDFKITGTVSSNGYTLTDSRINDEHWEVDWVQFGTSSNVIAGGSWSTDIVSHTLTLSATYSGSTSVVVNMHWVQ